MGKPSVERKMLRSLTKSMVGIEGSACLDMIASELCGYLEVECVILGEIIDQDSANGAKIRALSMIMDGQTVAEFEYDLKDTPCSNAIEQGYCFHPDNICELYPNDKDLIDMNAQGYIGSRLLDESDRAIGVLCAISRNKIQEEAEWKDVIEILGARASAEIYRKKAEEALQNKSDLLQAVYDANPDLQFVLDRNGIITDYHANNEDDLYVPPEEFIGKSMYEVLPTKVRDQFQKAFDAASSSNLVETIEYELSMPSGDLLHVEGRIVPLKDTRLVVTARDITERRNAEAERERMQAELRQSQKMEAIGTLAGGIAHEFNNLITPILGFSEMLMMNKAEDDPDFESLQQIQNAGNRARHLIQQMLAYGRQSLSQKESARLDTIVDNTLELLKNSTPSGITYSIQIDNDLPAILCMPNEISQVILNLCINATHAMPAGGEILIRVKNAGFHKFTSIRGKPIEGHFQLLSVRDAGNGMSRETLDAIFDPFFTTKEVGQGSGLGLSVVQGIIEQHEGHIDVQSKEAEGSTFDIYLPVNTGETQESKTKEDSPVKAELSPGGSEEILLIDDEAMIIDLTANMLQHLGYKVTSIIDAEEALQRFSQNPERFSLVITDYGMPKMNGKQLIEQIKQIRADIPAILITGYGDLVAKEEVKAWGLDGLLVKPFKLRELSEISTEVLG